jgi:hypothetical protein
MPYRLGGSGISLHDTACRSANLKRTAKRTSAGLLQRPTLWYAPAFGKTEREKPAAPAMPFSAVPAGLRRAFIRAQGQFVSGRFSSVRQFAESGVDCGPIEYTSHRSSACSWPFAFIHLTNSPHADGRPS